MKKNKDLESENKEVLSIPISFLKVFGDVCVCDVILVEETIGSITKGCAYRTREFAESDPND